jgi:long-chain acyl-CoA synthetase
MMPLRFPTCLDLLDELARHGERPVIEWREGGEWRKQTAAEAARAIVGIAQGLANAGIRPRERVAILRGSGPDYPLQLLGVIASGAIAVLLDPGLSAGELAVQLRDVRPRMILCSPALLPLASAAAAGLDLEIVDTATLAVNDQRELPRQDSHAACLIAFTSGSSGAPKGVLLPWGRLAFQMEQVGALLHRPGLAFLSVLPPHHLLELVVGILVPLSRGERVIFANTLLPHEILRLLAERDASYLITVPPLLELLAARLAQWQPGPGFTGFVCGGAAAPERLLRRCAEHGVSVYQGYGLTEAGPVISTNYPQADKPGSAGRLIPGTELRIGADGAIAARCPYPHGYWREGVELPRSPMSDWIETGDLGELDAEGFLHIRGRAKQIIVLASGKKVHPEEVETALAGNPHIEDVCVLGMPSRFEGSDEVVAVVWPAATLRTEHPQPAALATALLRALEPLRPLLAAWKWPARFIIAAAPLPRSSQQKLRRDLIRDLYCGSLPCPS